MRQLAQMTENYDTLKRSSEEGHGPLQAKTVEKNEEPVSVAHHLGSTVGTPTGHFVVWHICLILKNLSDLLRSDYSIKF